MYLKYLPIGNSSDQLSAPTAPTDVSIRSSVPLPSNSPKAPIPPPLVDPPSSMAQSVPPCSPRPSSEPSTSTPITSPPLTSSSPQIPNPEA